MTRKLIASKGYTIEVESCENDGDNCRTQSITVQSEAEAQMIKEICTSLFCSCNNGEGGIGNSMESEADGVIDEYIASRPELSLDREYIDTLADSLMGGSEWYDYRICESVTVTYSPEDVWLDVVG